MSRSEWKQRETEWKCVVFIKNYEKWSDKLKEKTGRAGTQELCSFLLLMIPGMTKEKEINKILRDPWKPFEEYKFNNRISTTKVRQWLKGEVCPDLSSIESICKVFEISPEEFEISSVPDYMRSYYSEEFQENETQIRHEYAQKIGASESFIHFVTHLDEIGYLFPSVHDGTFWEDLLYTENNPYLIKCPEDSDTSIMIDTDDIDYLKKLSAEVEEFIKGKMCLEKYREEKERSFLRSLDPEEKVEYYTNRSKKEEEKNG